MEEIIFSCPPDEVSCLVGNLFAELDPPCDAPMRSDRLTLCGRTHSGSSAVLFIYKDYCCFYGMREDLEAVRGSTCIERRCKGNG